MNSLDHQAAFITSLSNDTSYTINVPQLFRSFELTILVHPLRHSRSLPSIKLSPPATLPIHHTAVLDKMLSTILMLPPQLLCSPSPFGE